MNAILSFQLLMKSENSSKKFSLLGFNIGLASLELAIWLINEWTGQFISLLLILLSALILLISAIVERIERSKIPSWYFPLLWSILLVTLVIFGFYGMINGFVFDWQNAHL